MTGNTLDWTSSLGRDCPYAAADGRETPSPPGDRRAGRGGSWNSIQIIARPSLRLAFEPADRNSNVGLRVVRASPSLA